MAHSASPGSGRRSWREKGAAPATAAAPHSKALARWFFSLLALALVGMLIWILIPKPGNHTHLVVLPIKAYDKLVVPPIAFAAEDAQGLTKSTLLEATNLDLLQTSTGINNLAARLRDQVANPRDPLLLYVSAHGASGGDTAYLLCSDYRRSTAPGWCKVGDLLNQTRSTKAAVKVVILDCGRLANDARLGLLANEFTRLLDKEVAACPDSNLWVLVPNSLLQTSGVSYSQRKSVLGQCLAEALSGAADSQEEQGNSDGKVSLLELYRYVAGRSADWGDIDSGCAQTPLLMRGGIGIVDLEKNPQDIKPDPILIAVRRPPATEEEAEGKADKEKSDNKDEPKKPEGKETKQAFLWRGPMHVSSRFALVQAATETDTKAEKGKAEAQEPKAEPKKEAKESDSTIGKDKEEPQSADKPAPEPAQPPAKPAPKPEPVWTEELATTATPEVAELAAAWELRDQLQSRKPGSGWSPIDFAPHYWRRLNALLLASERQIRSGSDSQGPNLLAEIKALRRGLQSLSDAITNDADPPPAPTIMATEDRLLEAWRRFRVSPQRASWESDSPQSSDIKSALALYSDLVFAAPNFVAWHDQTSFIQASNPQFRDINDLLRRLVGLSQPLEVLEPGVADFSSVLAEELESLRDLRDRLDKQLTDEIARAEKQRQDPHTANGSAERAYENLLATPLLGARPRIKLLQELLASQTPLPRRVERALPKNPRDLAVSRQQWQRLLERTLLHQQLVQLADPAASSSLASAVQAAQQLSTNPAGKDAELLERYRTIGGLLEKYYDSLPRALAGGGSDLNPATAWRLGLQARIIDARDVRDGEHYPDLFPRALPPPAEVPRQLTLTAPASPLAAELKTWQVAEWEIATAGKGDPAALVTLKFPADLLEVRSAEGKQERLSENRQFPVPLGAGGKRLLKLEIRALKDREQAKQKSPIKLDVAVAWEEQRGSSSSEWTLPLADTVDIVVRREGSQYEQFNRSDRLSLRPYPNRQTGFRFSLVNRSGKSKQVKVDLLAARRPVTATWAPGRMFTVGGKLRPGIYQEHFDSEGILSWRVKLLASTGEQPLELPADASSRPLNLYAPGAAPAAESDKEKEKKDAPAAKPPAAQEPPAEEITDGLLCIIRDAADEKLRWIKWIELAPLAPHDYLAAKVAYEPAKERIEIQLTPALTDENGREVSPKEALPPDIAEKPIKVAWDLDDEVKVKKVSLDYSLAQPVGTLWAEVPPDGSKRRVRLAVDQYPRALVYDVLCDRVPRTVDLKPTLQEIHVERVSLAGYSRMFRFDDGPQPAGPQWIGTGEKKQQLLTIASSAVAPFPAPCEALHVKLAVDAPKDAFELPLIEREDAIEVVLGDDQDRRRFFSDRQIEAVLKKIEPQGLLVIETSVSDHEFDLRPEGLQGQEAPIVARLMLGGAVAAGPHRVRVLLDGSEPEILNFATKPPHTLPLVIGTPLKAELRVKDQSGVEKVEFGFDKDAPGTLEKMELLGEIKKAPVSGAYVFDLDTKDLKPGEYNLLAKVTDRVGFESHSRPLLLTVVSPTPTVDPKNPNAPPTAKKGVIRGVVKYRMATADEDLVTVTLEGSDQPPQRTGRNGEFKFTNVAPGKYTLKAEGSFQNRQRNGELKDVSPAPPESAPLLVVPVN